MRRMRYLFAVPIFLLAFIIQTTILWRFPVFGYSANLLLCMVIVFSFIYDERYGLILGIIFGLMLDISTSYFMSVQTITFVFAFIIARIVRNIFDHERYLPDMLLAVIATPVNILFVWVINRLAGIPDTIIYSLKSLLPILIMNVLTVALLHFIFVRTVIKHKQDMKFTGEL